MKNKNIITILAVLGLLLTQLSDGSAGELPQPGGKPLSAILKSVEEQRLGSITEAEFDDGYWEVKICGPGACRKLYLDPRTGEEKRRSKTDSDEMPPPGSMSISAIIQSVEARGLGTITEVEFDDGLWQVELRRDDRKIKLAIDPMTGESTR